MPDTWAKGLVTVQYKSLPNYTSPNSKHSSLVAHTQQALLTVILIILRTLTDKIDKSLSQFNLLYHWTLLCCFLLKEFDFSGGHLKAWEVLEDFFYAKKTSKILLLQDKYTVQRVNISTQRPPSWEETSQIDMPLTLPACQQSSWVIMADTMVGEWHLHHNKQLKQRQFHPKPKRTFCQLLL